MTGFSQIFYFCKRYKYKKMYKIKVFFFISLFFFTLFNSSFSQNRINIEEYIDTYSPIAVEHMKTYGIPASIKLAQAIIESAFGNSDLAKNANNHFGIKCHNWQGETYHKDDDAKDECFRKYNSPIESFYDHSVFLSTRQRYAFLFDLDITDYRGWARGLSQAGYATNPRYPELLIGVIERNNLQRFDSGAEIELTAEDRRKQREKVTVAQTDRATRQSPTREIRLNNRVKYILAQAGDTPESIASMLDMAPWQIYKYNGLEKGDVMRSQQRIYLQPKRRRSFEHERHVVQRGENIKSISETYAVKEQHLFRMNPNIHPDGLLNEGQVILLRKGSLRRR